MHRIYKVFPLPALQHQCVRPLLAASQSRGLFPKNRVGNGRMAQADHFPEGSLRQSGPNNIAL